MVSRVLRSGQRTHVVMRLRVEALQPYHDRDPSRRGEAICTVVLRGSGLYVNSPVT